MFAKAPESLMRGVRGVLAFLWLALIVSLFWAPVMPHAADSGGASPPHTAGREVLVQGHPLEQSPYALGARIFWTMVVPLLPLFMMVFGHEAWRRICPLSLFAQLPGYLGRQRRIKRISSSSGRVEVSIPVVGRESWLARNHWYLQFGLLAAGVAGRLLFYNANRYVLAGAMLAVIVSAVVVGALYGGKTWCQYICPVSVVQKVYTEPGGLFESKAAGAPAGLSQSTCRRPTSKGDSSSCVGCAALCSDIDLERHHWHNVGNRSRPFVYYGYFGLTVGFFTYFWWYAGSWDYFFSGLWTRDALQPRRWFEPGFFVAGHAVPIPMLLAVPLYLGVCILAAWRVGLALENGWVALRSRRRPDADSAVLRHQCLIVSAILSFGVFYFFAGRSILRLLPTWAQWTVCAGLVLIGGLWLIRNLRRTPRDYHRDGVRADLLARLPTVVPDTEVLFGRVARRAPVEQIVSLASALPGFTADDRRQVYLGLVNRASHTGAAGSAQVSTLLADVQKGLALNDIDHGGALAQTAEGAGSAVSDEGIDFGADALRLRNYGVELAELSAAAGKDGLELAAYLRTSAGALRLRNMRAQYRISDEEHDNLVAAMALQSTDRMGRLEEILAELVGRTALRHRLRTDAALHHNDCARWLVRLIDDHRRQLAREVLDELADAVDSDERWAAQQFYLAAADVIPDVLASSDEHVQWAGLGELVTNIVAGRAAAPGGRNELRSAIAEAQHAPISSLLATAARGCQTLIEWLCLQLLADIEPGRAVALLDRAGAPVADAQWMHDSVRSHLDHPGRPGKLDLLARLANLDLTASMETEALLLLAGHVTFVELAAGEGLCRQHDPSNAIYVLYSGALEVWREDSGGLRHLVDLGPNDVAGELGVILQGNRTASLRAGSGGAQVISIDGLAIHELSRDKPEIGDYLLRRAVVHLRRQLTLTATGTPA